MQLGSKTERYLGRIIQVAYYIMILLGLYYFMLYAFWPVFPFLFSFFVAMLLQKPMNYAHSKLRIKKSFTAIALVLLFYLLIIGLAGYAGVRLIGGVKSFFDYISSQDPAEIVRNVAVRVPDMLRWLPDKLHGNVESSVADFIARMDNGEDMGVWALVKDNVSLEWFKTPVSGLLTTAGKIPALLLAVLITVISSFFMTLSYDSLVRFIKRQLSPARQDALSAAKRIFVGSLGKLFRSYVTIMAITFGELLLGLGLLLMIGVRGIFEVKYLVPIALAIAALDILPVLGSGSILTIWAVYELIIQNYGFGAGLLAIGAVIFMVRQVLEPKLVASNLGLPPIVTLAGMYIGIQIFGFVGLFLVPMLLILIKLLNDEGVIHVWKPAPAGEWFGEKAPKKEPFWKRWGKKGREKRTGEGTGTETGK